MDYELMMNGNVKLGQEAPDFTANSTIGKINLKEYRGKWVVLFSHPGDFTPVCTTEIIAFEKAITYFKNMNAELIGLSIDSNSSHLAWLYDIYVKTGITISYPIVADRSGEIARKYGMIASNISNTATVRNVFIIDDKGIVRLILVYPMNIGRNISEILRALNALQTADANNQMAPANWVPCDPMIVPAPETFNMLQKRVSDMEQEGNGMSWYLNFKNPNNCQTRTIPNLNTDSNLSLNRMSMENRIQSFNNSIPQNTISNIPQNNNTENINNTINQLNQSYSNDSMTKNQRNRSIQWKNFR